MLENPTKSEGKCLFCGKTFAKASINRHLKTHLEEKAGNGSAGVSYLVKVETAQRRGYGSTPYFLSLWIDGEATMKTIDKFLRDIWLECCGHLSAFRVSMKQRSMNNPMQFIRNSMYNMSFDNDGDIAMSKKVKSVFRSKDLKIDYEYDFGSTTALQLTAIDIFPIKADKKIVLISRNEPIGWLCDKCGKEKATQVCSICEDESIFCDKCASKHAEECEDFADYASMPVVNSPRMGVCGYVGGVIDKERD
ncbi:MAG: plasmid pRiA4b ORF-3 family protein [Planctomycetaceae bacterium]|jgi:hypothetical protein|nr:plasmid pRiA4b ORF-3 family protein [Planctomycetaceae bacterium]